MTSDPAKRPATTKVRCPKCQSADLSLIETGTWTSLFRVRDGKLDRSDGSHEPSSVDRLEGHCVRCGHRWKVRGATQIDHAVVEQ